MKKTQNTVVAPEVIKPMTYGALLDGLGELSQRAERKVASAINEAIVLAYWHMGKCAVEYKQHVRLECTRTLAADEGRAVSSSCLVKR